MRAVLDGVQAGHAALAGSVPRGVHLLLDGASHQTIHLQHPVEIVAAIRGLVEHQRATIR